MLKKLLKHEFRALSKSIVVILALVLATSVATALLSRATSGLFSNNNIGSGFISGLFGLFAGLGLFALFATPIVTLILVINRFYNNFFKDEGYLTFTLPVPTSSLYNAKIIGSATMLVVSAIIGISGAVFTMMILTGNNENFLNTALIKEIFDVLKMVFEIEFTMTEVILIIELIVYLVVETIGVLMLIFLAISLSCTRFNKRRILIGIAIYYAFNIGKNIINTIVLAFVSGFNLSTSAQDDLSTATVFMLITILVSIGISIFAYTYNNKILAKNLNLD